MNTWDKIKLDRIGQSRTNKDGVLATVTDYQDTKHITFVYPQYNIIGYGKWERFDKGKFATPKEYYIEDKVGKRYQNHNNEWATCIQYYDSENAVIQFDDKTTERVKWGNFTKGSFGGQRRHSVYGGIYDSTLPIKDVHGKTTKEYDAWLSMFKRCYSEKVHQKRNTYINCNVSNEWKYFSNFYQWLISQDNYEQWKQGGKNWHVDKDILVKNNTIYGSQYCLLVPAIINGLLLKCNANRGKYPIGVYYDKSVDLYKAVCHNPYKKRQVTVGYFEDANAAFYNGYKPYKERVVQIVAQNEYEKGTITKPCFEALMNYKVEITD